ncbi:YCF48-related protein [uncultured Draconibacterium sp.]|uniref:YCF48-related protein n=1 Tax=uncultured Draconibacterium sp. TaxID=1573823 RepID=UPI002AA64677|nr:YCF48-related protein [uncultured Draconibacterium sp.]
MKNFTLLILSSLMGLCALAQNPIFDWKQDTLSEGNTLQKMTINGDYATIAGYNNTFLTSSDGGETWTSLNLVEPHYNLIDISIEDSVGFIVTSREKLYDADQYVYTNGVIFKTTDEGETWTTIEPLFDTINDPSVNPFADLCFGVDFQAVETVNDSTAYCAARWYEYLPGDKESHSALFKTTNGGLNWRNISGDLGGSTVNCIEFKNENGFIGGSKLLYRTTITADTIVDIFPYLPGDSSAFIYDIENISETEIYVTSTSDSVFVSTDLGNSFEAFKGIDGGSDIYKLNDSTIILTDSKDMYVSVNNGQVWDKYTFPAQLYEIGGVANDSLLFLSKSTIYKVSVQNILDENFSFVEQALGNQNLQKAAFNNNNLIIVGLDLNFHQSTDGGLTWIAKEIPPIPALDELYQNIDFYGMSGLGDEAYACVNRFQLMNYPSSSDKEDVYWSGGVFYTDDNWQTYKSVDIADLGEAFAGDPTVNPYHDSCNGVNTSVIHYAGDDVLLLWARWNDFSGDTKEEHSRVFKSIDAGKNWVPLTEDLGNKYVQDIQSRGDSLYIAGRQLLLFSENAAQKELDPLPPFTDLYPNVDSNEDDAMFINAITLGNQNEFFVVTSTDSCFMTSDNGTSFKTLGNLKGANDFYKFDDNSYIIMGSRGSIFTNDGGTNWIDCDLGEVIFETGGVFNNKFYALARGSVYTNDLNNFDLKTSIPTLFTKAELKVAYTPTSINLISTNGEIEHCSVYTINGSLVTQVDPNNSIYRLNNNEYKSGIYLVNSIVGSKRYINKIAFR